MELIHMKNTYLLILKIIEKILGIIRIGKVKAIVNQKKNKFKNLTQSMVNEFL